MFVKDKGRRKTLEVLVGTLIGLPGCVSFPSHRNRNSTTDQSECEELQRVRVADPIEGPTADAFELRLIEIPVEVGDPMVVELRNTTDEAGVTENRYKYVVQRRSNESWESVQRVEKMGFWTDGTVGHPPNDGFRWEFTFSKTGLTRENNGNADYHVCEELQPGNYRFVYFGLLGDEAVASEPFVVERGDGTDE